MIAINRRMGRREKKTNTITNVFPKIFMKIPGGPSCLLLTNRTKQVKRIDMITSGINQYPKNSLMDAFHASIKIQ